MKTYTITNGSTFIVLQNTTFEQARTTAINVCDHSKEIVITENKSYEL